MTKLSKVNPFLNFIRCQFTIQVLLFAVLVLTSVVNDMKEHVKTRF